MRTRVRSGQPVARRVQRGAATLVVVMVLFFIVALVAAYTSRNLIFEQRTAANQYRATQAFEAAEAGLEWGLAMLNSGRINAACQPHVDPATADESFRLRYLDIAPDTGQVTPRLRADGQPRQAACVFDGAAWQCSCPEDAAPALAEPVGPGPYPAFVLRFFENNPAYPAGSGPYPPGVVRIQSTGCTRLDAGTICAAAATSGDGRATVTSLAAMKSALATLPAAPVTVRGNLNRAAGALATWEVVNPDLATGGITVHAGGEVLPPNIDWLIAGRPGTPVRQSFFEEDAPMFDLDDDEIFASVFGIGRNTYRLQPAAVLVRCALDCSAATVRDLARLNPGRVLWIDGNFNIDIADPIGSADPLNPLDPRPVMLVVTGNISISDPDAKFNGVLYMTGASWQHGGGSKLTLRGALISEAKPDLTVSGADTDTAHIKYDRELLDLLHRTHGSFVRVPGSWRDF